MFNFFKKKLPDPSKVRQWIDKDYKQKTRTEGKGLSAIQILSDDLLYGVSRFGAPNRYLNYKSVLKPYIAEDLALFEWACFVYYIIAGWHTNHKVHENQVDTFQFLLHDMIKKFEELAGFKNAEQIAENRFDIYHLLGEQDEETTMQNIMESPLMFHLEQLIMKSTSEGKLTPYKINGPSEIGSFFESCSLKIAVGVWIGAILPRCIDHIEKYYKWIK
jgi:hypothetical protein